MKNKKKKLLTALGGLILCGGLSAWAAWDAVKNHGGRLVYPMDSYAFQPSDIPMLLAISLDFLYIISIVAWLVVEGVSQRKQVRQSNHTRRISPKLGLLGILGLFGFLGFYTYFNYKIYFPFCFFAFFGFFGFFFEGKMSNTFMDERFQANRLRAQRDASAAGMIIAFLLLVIIGQGRTSVELALLLLMIGLSLDMALTGFLNEYLLYRYDHDDAAALEDE